MAAPAGTEQYSQYTQFMVGAWRRLLETRQVGPTPIPWVVLWGAATGLLLALEELRPTFGAWGAGIILVASITNAILKRG